MSASTKLSTSVKALCYLEEVHPKPVSSSEIAGSIGINSSKLRRILSLLVKNGIVESNSGTKGGFKLKKLPAQIHLQEIYCAIEDRKAFHLDVRKDSIKKNSLPEKLNFYFLDLFAEVQVDIEDKMKKITLQSIINKINNN
ncbi:MAG TPA: Rrf2 family transcriptional regulator [Ignavibacteriaceae bacterium]|nr:Rrf2 family transcriptional regulator [Ignavibacteriaceae bacterium]